VVATYAVTKSAGITGTHVPSVELETNWRFGYSALLKRLTINFSGFVITIRKYLYI